MKQLKLEKIVSRDVDFSKWYTSVIFNAKLIAYSPVKGSIILKPYGYAIWERIQAILNVEFSKNNIQNLYMPLLIPKSLFNKEKEMIEGFAPECLTVTKVGDKLLEEELIIRPTSEVLFGYFFANEVQTYNDLPLKYNQWANVFRWEKTTRPFLRTTEFLWQEGHTLHSSAQEAEDFALTMIKVYENFIKKYLVIPAFVGQKTEKEKFSGAKKTYTIECLMHDGQALQSATSHYFADKFSKTFNIKFLNKLNKMEHPFYTSWGVSTRLIGALIMTHADDNGLVLPFNIAPIQIKIVLWKNTEKLLSYANSIKILLEKKYRIEIDLTNKSFGFKRAETEIMGIPVRIEIGEKELQNNSVTLVRRDNYEKMNVNAKEVLSTLKNLFLNYDKNLYNKAEQNVQNKIKSVDTFEEYLQLIKKDNVIVLAPFCGKMECEIQIKLLTQTNSRCIPLTNYQTTKNCFKCKEQAYHLVYFARAY